ncbi:MAG: LiaF-related protein [Candidatus Cloacimonetes bacterium]|jgi:predicted membrane protein|nr:LiaF-related protein [Candidatus Cloacimonadota bacterium]
MPFLFSGLFWGVMLVLFGISMILRAVFNLDIPIFRIVFALVIIYFGVKLLVGRQAFKGDRNFSMFRSSNVTMSESGGEYNVIFGQSNIDLSNIDISESSQKVEVNIVFGSGNLLIDPQKPMKISVSTVFADCKLPKRNINFFGDSNFKTPGYVEGENYLKLDIDVVFGNAVIMEKVQE